MNRCRIYSPFRPVPAPLQRDSDGSVRSLPCRYARSAATHTVPPLKGLPGTRATDVSYRASVPAGHAGRGVALSYWALAPGGAGFCCRICTGTSKSRPTANFSLLTANSTYTFSAKEKDSETGLSYFGARYYSSDLSVWLSVDPMSDKYPSLSPYVYCADNPVRCVDPNGDTISLLGDDWETALAHMQKHCPNLEISRGENECLSYSYKQGVKYNQKGEAIISDEEAQFCVAIDSKEVKVSLTVNYNNVYTAKNGKRYKSNMGGGFLGSKYNDNETADAEQFVSMLILNKYYASKDIERLLLHEATEAYWGGKRAIKLQRNTCVPQTNIFGKYEECDDYNYAHNKAVSQPSTRFGEFMQRASYDLLLYYLGKGR